MPALTISNRIIAGFAAITLILLLLGSYALGQIGSVRTTVDLIVQRDIGAMRQLDGVQASLARMVEMRTGAVRRELLGVSDGDVDFADSWRAESRKASAALDTMRANVAEYRERAVTDERAEQWRAMGERLDMARTIMSQLRGHVEAQLTAIRAGDRAGMLAAEPQVVRDRAALLEQVLTIRGILDRAVDAGRTASQDVYERSRVSITIALVLAVAISIGVAWTIRRSIIGPLGGFMAFVERVGTGDLSGDAAVTGTDEIGRLGTTLNAMVEGLRSIARQNREATENLNAATTEIRASTQQQAASVEEQLAAVQETAATVDEITHSGSQISRRAQDVIAAARATADTTDAGVAAVEDTVKAMQAIRAQAEAVAANIVALSEKTQAIGEIIATVNDVSERTHLLALNAAIEAAAAGEAGRSFAIVATEMKTLADQAKGATRDVRGLLGDIQRGINASVMLTEEAVKRVEAGRQQTDTAQAAIEDMGARVQDSVQTFQQIVASTNQQQIGIEQVTIALQNVRQASQQTAASTRQLDQAAGDLAGLARLLVGQTERYRL